VKRSSLNLRILVSVALLLALATFCEAKPGFYSVNEIDGVWWFIDPAGKPFYSLGVCDIGAGPPRDKYDPSRPCYAAFRHYDSNEEWAAHTIQRLTDWKFNTIGGWADEDLMRGPLPYAIVLHMGAEVGFPWNDVFSDDFVETLDRFAQRRVKPRSNDKHLLGWYSDNEQGWYPDTLFSYHLGQAGESKTRSRLIEMLVREYEGDFAALERDFEVVGALSFDDLSRGGQLKLRPESGGRRVILGFTALLAERYYQVVHDCIRRYDPNHLILGDRYARHCPAVVAKAAGPYVDVISTNLDWPEAKDGYMPSGYLRNLHRMTGRPVLITEYYVAARENRSGNKNTGGIFLTVETQTERTAAVETRLRGLVAQPYVIGAHWFRFADEPTHGRPKDGEDYNFGLVDIENQPYEGLTKTLVKLHAKIPQLRRESAKSKRKTTDYLDVLPHSVEARDMQAELARATELSLEDDTLQVYEVLSAWSEEAIQIAVLTTFLAQRETYSTSAEPQSQQLELEFTSPAFDNPLTIPFPSVGGASEVAGVRCWLSINGIHHTLVVTLPAEMFGKQELERDDRLQLGVAINDLLNQTSTVADVQLRLAGEAERGGQAPELTSAGE
jgi:hypothetical protein